MNEDNICDIAGAEREIIPGRRKLGCDEIAWISAALDRFAAVARNRNIYSERSMKGAKLACLLEIMDVAGCEFEDDVARHNALSDFPELCPDRDTLVPVGEPRSAPPIVPGPGEEPACASHARGR